MGAQLRVLHLIKHCGFSNGHVNVAVDLACMQARAGHTVAVGSAGGGYVDFFEAHGVAHHRVSIGRSPVALFGGMVALLRFCRSFKPDVIHAHMMSSAVLGYLASRYLGVPLVTTMHNSFDQHSGLMRLGDAVVAVSEAERRLLLSRRYPEHKVLTIRNGTVGSPRETMAQRVPLPEFATPCIATVCGLHGRKGVHHLISAFACVAGTHPDWHLNIIGEGPDAAKLQAQAERLGLATRVHFLGSVRNPRPLLQRASIFALASLAEPFGLVLVEARSAGCAVISTDVGGTAEALGHGMAGQLVEAGNPDAMAAVFEAVMASPSRLEEWRARARDNLGSFTVERAAAKHIALYEMLRRRIVSRPISRGVAPRA